MSDQPLAIYADVWNRVKRAVLKTELPTAPASASALTAGPCPPPIRAILCEQLDGQGQALALRTRRIVSHQIQEVTALRASGLSDEQFLDTFTLRYKGIDSLPIKLGASDEEFLDKLLPWSLAGLKPGDLFVYGGTLTPEEVPATSPLRPTVPLKMYQWTVAFVGPQFDTTDPFPIESIAQPEDLSSIVIAYESKWEPYGDPVIVFEGGLRRPPSTAVSYQYEQNYYYAGTAVLCVWMPDAEGYVVYEAENKRVEDYNAIWLAWLTAHAWQEFVTDFGDGDFTILWAINDEVDTGWGWGWGGNGGRGWGFGAGGPIGGGLGPFVGRRVLVRSSGTLPAPLLPDTVYYLLSYSFTTRRFQLSLTEPRFGTEPIEYTDDGDGTHEIQLYSEQPPLPS